MQDKEDNIQSKMSVVRIYLQPAFVICVLVLAIAASGMSFAVKSLGVYLEKEPFPLKKPLDLLDENSLAPYKVIRKVKIENKEIIKGLGTESYIQWVLEDTDLVSLSGNSPVRRCLLFITYYELPDIVVHVPDECYTGSGHQRLISESVMLEIGNKERVSQEAEILSVLGATDSEVRKIPARYLVISRPGAQSWQPETKFPVMYLFNVNNVYADNREETRLILNRNIFGKYSYFCKVEWSFLGGDGYPTREEAVMASNKLLSVILPILEKDHLPSVDK